ncbi:MAG: GIY-YIG nuclease family protein [Rhizomicrobium sp.]
MPREHRYFVYIMASARNGTLYVGVTNDLIRRAYEHREGLVEGFTKKYGVKTLVWFEEFRDVRDAIDFEKRLKKWERSWKIRLIEELIPTWKDVARDL